MSASFWVCLIDLIDQLKLKENAQILIESIVIIYVNMSSKVCTQFVRCFEDFEKIMHEKPGTTQETASGALLSGLPPLNSTLSSKETGSLLQ